VAQVCAEQQHKVEDIGQPMLLEDSYIAAIALRHNLTVVTGNEKNFRRPGVKLFNPFESNDSGN
jgi:predicted nucleic acid-binding protein